MNEQTERQLIFNDASELIKYLDTNIKHWNPCTHDRGVCAALRSATSSADAQNLLHAEILGFEVWFEDTVMKRRGFTTNTDQTINAPWPLDLATPPFAYYLQRFQETPNPFLKARYGLLLWNSPAPYKRQDYLQGSLDGLLTALSQADCIGTQSGRRDCLDMIKQLCEVAATLKYKHRADDVRAAVLGRYKGVLPVEQQSRPALLRIINDHGKLFRSSTDEILEATRILFSENMAAGDAYAGLMLAQLAAKTAQAGGSDVREWHYRQGQANEAQAEARMSDDSSMVSMSFYADAARAYQLAGDEAAEQAALQKAQSAKDNLRLSTVSSELGEEHNKMLNEDIKAKTAQLLALDPLDIFEWLGTAPDAIPDFDAIQKNAAQAPTSFADLLSVMSIDVNKNFQHEGGTSEKVRMGYNIAITLRLHYLHSLFIEGFKAGKITFATFQNFLKQRSWTSRPLPARNTQGEEFEYTWEPLLLPSCNEFFKQLDLALAGEESKVSFVLCLDSMVPKIEALLRELIQITGSATVATGSKGGLHEVFFDELLETIEKGGGLTTNEAQFFRYVFTPFSQNLRNNIAHGYYKLAEQYSFASAILVFCALMRLIGFQLNEVRPEDIITE
jgi:hypothetical protein